MREITNVSRIHPLAAMNVCTKSSVVSMANEMKWHRWPQNLNKYATNVKITNRKQTDSCFTTLGFSKPSRNIWLYKYKQNRFFNVVHIVLNLHWCFPFSQVFSDPLTVGLRIYESDWLECGLILSSLFKGHYIIKITVERKYLLHCKLVHHSQMKGEKEGSNKKRVFFTHTNTLIIFTDSVYSVSHPAGCSQQCQLQCHQIIFRT